MQIQDLSDKYRKAITDQKILHKFADAKKYRWHTYFDLLKFATDNLIDFKAFVDAGGDNNG